MTELKKTWQLDPRLERDSILIRSNDAWQTRLVNDRRWPWLILVPVVPGAIDLEDLDQHLCDRLFREAALVSCALKAMRRPGLPVIEKTNIATIGNMVNQFHLHIVGRHKDDPNWPKPVWGFETAIAYDTGSQELFLREFNAAWQTTVSLASRL